MRASGMPAYAMRVDHQGESCFSSARSFGERVTTAAGFFSFLLASDPRPVTADPRTYQ